MCKGMEAEVRNSIKCSGTYTQCDQTKKVFLEEEWTLRLERKQQPNDEVYCVDKDQTLILESYGSLCRIPSSAVMRVAFQKYNFVEDGLKGVRMQGGDDM